MTLPAGPAQAAMDEMSVHQARLQIAAARERSAKLELVQQLEEQRTEKEAALEVRRSVSAGSRAGGPITVPSGSTGQAWC